MIDKVSMRYELFSSHNLRKNYDSIKKNPRGFYISLSLLLLFIPLFIENQFEAPQIDFIINFILLVVNVDLENSYYIIAFAKCAQLRFLKDIIDSENYDIYEHNTFCSKKELMYIKHVINGPKETSSDDFLERIKYRIKENHIFNYWMELLGKEKNVNIEPINYFHFSNTWQQRISCFYWLWIHINANHVESLGNTQKRDYLISLLGFIECSICRQNYDDFLPTLIDKIDIYPLPILLIAFHYHVSTERDKGESPWDFDNIVMMNHDATLDYLNLYAELYERILVIPQKD